MSFDLIPVKMSALTFWMNPKSIGHGDSCDGPCIGLRGPAMSRKRFNSTTWKTRFSMKSTARWIGFFVFEGIFERCVSCIHKKILPIPKNLFYMRNCWFQRSRLIGSLKWHGPQARGFLKWYKHCCKCLASGRYGLLEHQ